VQDSSQWRELLGKIIRDTQERQRIANELGISAVTLTRWASGDSRPRPQNLRLLINALPPDHRRAFLELIPEEFGASINEVVDVDRGELEIPSVFYARILSAHCSLPRLLHFNSISDVILQQALKQLDSNRVGMEITVVQCMYPTPEGKIRSLRESIGRGTPPWNRELEQRTLFLGSESLAGYVVSTGRPRAIESRSEGQNLFPARWVEWEESAMAYPIMLSDTSAGCLLISCTQPHYFVSDARQRLVQYYAELLSVAFDMEAFYPLGDIELGRMPGYDLQNEYLATFRQRTSSVMIQKRVSVPEAERMVWQQLEEDLLQAAYAGG
jgi:transcriptional regulator with XRE-family HTH domain